MDMFKLQYLMPDRYPPAIGSFDKSISEMCARLKGVDIKFVAVPDSALSIRLYVMENTTSVEIKKRGHLVYINVFCYDSSGFLDAFAAVNGLYGQFNLGEPKHPKMATWIHSIPIAHDRLRENEVTLCQKMTVSFYWAVFAQRLNKQNQMN